MKTKVIVFDFDGVVVLDSDGVKQRAWPKVFEKYGDAHREHLDAAHEMYGGGKGGDRFDTLRHVYRAFGESEETIQELVREGAKTFDEHVQHGIKELGVPHHTRELLSHLAQRYPLYLNTATPLEPFMGTVASLGIGEYFKGVFGRPNSKVENFRIIAEKESADPAEFLFIGDADTDRKAAEEFGCRFLGLANDSNGWGNAQQTFTVIKDLGEIKDFLD